MISLARSGTGLMSPVGMAVAGPAAGVIGVRCRHMLISGVTGLVAWAALLTPAVVRIEEGGSPAMR